MIIAHFIYVNPRLRNTSHVKQNHMHYRQLNSIFLFRNKEMTG